MSGRLVNVGYHYNGAALSGGPQGGRAAAASIIADVADGGPGFIAGSTYVDGVLMARTVFLLDRISKRLVRSTRADALGAYRFERLALGREWIVLGVDELREHNAVVADRITAVT